ncbi:MAG: hypothetical protein BGO03_11970 [Mesorhizobium sp. 61-13]|nr:MAG: hypothetical protein BGO03_11970 [Mesorhizobium sp. 61-13]
MLAVKSRLARLEKQIGAASGLLVVVKAGPSDDEVSSLLSERGIDPDNPNHQIIILRTLYEDKSGRLAPDQPKAGILYTMSMN